MSMDSDARKENFLHFLRSLGFSVLIVGAFFVLFTIWGDALRFVFPSSIGENPGQYAVIPSISLFLLALVMGITHVTAEDGTGRAALFFFFLVPTANVIMSIIEMSITQDLACSYMMGASFIVMMYCYIRLGVGSDAKAPVFMNLFMPFILYMVVALVLKLISLGSPVATFVVSLVLVVVSFVVTIIVRNKMGSVVDEYR